ncbi:uncharacterized protein PGTG_10610 [Puccinia graminis f. sp. tritici CRL 75-36-700-3]|uniref:Cyclic nucleotide-binding domain-containing protein n=1 Tax=Puccinia graminis f. sp. tritici (strain CRL 75-36-700-3 / race SCCL) TaxID=418459 RepID=E3KIV7_PUCGT|nr:uncharacterized protein PGTG_10610 [Puccinia graminis f. sp. tritici CRL 75-36-700-3]EFP84232.2 hypothetical protein PGTG_10610 [Puccinia graminis f. sp. tritici CRL 75-36-700-3]
MTQPNNQHSYLNIINELEREIIRAAPNDLLQFCSAWFQFKLEQERTQIRQQLNQLNSVYQQQQQQHQNQQLTYHSNYPSNHPSYYHQQQQQPTLCYSFNQPPPNNFPTTTTTTNNNNGFINPPAHRTPAPINQNQHHPYQPISPNQSLRSPAPTYHSSPGPLTAYSLASATTVTNNNNNSNRSMPTIQPQQPTPPVAEEESDDDSSSDDSSHVPLVPAGYNFGRRVSVSAESLSPFNRDDGPIAPKKVVPKTHNQRQRIENSIKDNLLFRYLDEEQHDDVVNAMEELTVTQGTEVIVQGAVGDFFYVVEEGTFDVYIRGPRTYTYVPAPSNGAQGTLVTMAGGESLVPTTNLTNGLSASSASAESGAGSIQRGSTPFGGASNGTTVTHQAPSKKVFQYGPGGAFGELALMHNAPRAATVVATSPTATLWALDRVTFRSILINHTATKRKMYENFLSEVPIFVSLSPTEISKIADSLEDRSFPEGVDVIKEGELGREFFIIESGRAEVYKKRVNSNLHQLRNSNNPQDVVEEELVGILGKGDHFGELALLNSAPRAATVRVAKGTGRLRVAALGEKAFTRLLGPVIDILSRHAASHYGADVGVGGHGQGGTEATGSSSSTMAGGNNDGQSAHLELNSPRSTSFSLPPLPPSSSSSSSTAPAASHHSPSVAGRPSPAAGFAGWNGLNGRLTPADDSK